MSTLLFYSWALHLVGATWLQYSTSWQFEQICLLQYSSSAGLFSLQFVIPEKFVGFRRPWRAQITQAFPNYIYAPISDLAYLSPKYLHSFFQPLSSDCCSPNDLSAPSSNSPTYMSSLVEKSQILSWHSFLSTDNTLILKKDMVAKSEMTFD